MQIAADMERVEFAQIRRRQQPTTSNKRPAGEA